MGFSITVAVTSFREARMKRAHRAVRPSRQRVSLGVYQRDSIAQERADLRGLAVHDPMVYAASSIEWSNGSSRWLGSTLAIDWSKVDLEEFRRGLEVELEHGARDPETNVTSDDMTMTGKIAWAHLKEFPDYYTRLDRFEAEADAYWGPRR